MEDENKTPDARGLDYAAAFDAIPLPATLIDAAGVVLDVNQAFLDLAHTYGLALRKEDRIGGRIASFGATEEERVRFRAFIDEVLRTGETQDLEWAGENESGRALFWRIRARALSDASGEVAGGMVLREDITEAKGQQIRQDALRRVRDAVWQMENSEDIRDVLSALRTGLRELGVPFQDCGINLVHPDGDPPVVSYNSLGSDGEWQSPEDAWGGDLISRIWQEGALSYRPDLEAEDPHGEHPRYEEHFGHPVRSVVDVPFSRGTLALNSPLPNAFSDHHVAILRAMGEVLSEGFGRVEDLQNLEQRNRELEAEISERRRAEEATRESEHNLVAAQRLAHIGSWVWLLDTDQVACSDEMLRIWGYAPEKGGLTLQEVMGRIHSDDRDRVGEALERAVQGDVQYAEEFRLVLPDGSERLIHGMGHAERGTPGQRPVMRGTGQDITEHRQMELALEREHRMQQAEAAARVTIAEMDKPEDLCGLVEGILRSLRQVGVEHDDCAIQVVNVSGTGFVSVGVDGFAPGALELVTDRDSAPRIATANAERYPWVIDVWKTGKPRHDRCASEDSHMVPGMSVLDVPFSHGTLAINSNQPDAFCERHTAILKRFATVLSSGFQRFLDIVERRQAERELIRLERLRAVGQLSAGVSHNLNNILTSVLGPAQLLKRHTDDPALLGEIDRIIASGKRARDLVHQLHLSVRTREEESLQPVSVNTVVQQAVQAARPRWKDEPEADGVTIDVVADLGDVAPIRGGEAGLYDILTNLIFNAVDAMPSGGTITIRTETVADEVRVAFSDTGIGMDEETRTQVFEPFFTTKMDLGTGLGLATVYNTVTGWGGAIAVASSPGQGTTFTLSLPIWGAEV